jgi:hypothetical protein
MNERTETRQPSKVGATAALLGFAFAGWAFCAAIMGGLPPLIGMEAALVVHVVAGPLGFALLAVLYQRRFGRYLPVTVAATFLGFVLAMDFFFVALLILGSLSMFRSPLGTWIPFALIFLTSWGAGAWARQRRGL